MIRVFLKFEVEREYEDSQDMKERLKGTKKKKLEDLRRKVFQHGCLNAVFSSLYYAQFDAIPSMGSVAAE